MDKKELLFISLLFSIVTSIVVLTTFCLYESMERVENTNKTQYSGDLRVNTDPSTKIYKLKTKGH